MSEIRTVHGEEDEEEDQRRAGTISEDTRARADELEGGESSDMEGVEEEEQDELEEYTPVGCN